jgi:hypothetical protein
MSLEVTSFTQQHPITNLKDQFSSRSIGILDLGRLCFKHSVTSMSFLILAT